MTMTSSEPSEMLCRMRSLYHGTEGSVVDCAAAMKPSSWLSIRMAMSSMYSWLGRSVRTSYRGRSSGSSSASASVRVML